MLLNIGIGVDVGWMVGIDSFDWSLELELELNWSQLNSVAT